MLVNCNFVGYKHPSFDGLIGYNRDIRKVKKRQHQYPEFGHTQGEIKKIPAKKYISIQGGMKLRNPSILMDF